MPLNSRSQAPLGTASLEAPLPGREAELRTVCSQAELGNQIAWVTACVLLSAIPSSAQEPPTYKSLREMIDASVQQVEVVTDPESKSAAEPLVALRWANNARGSEDGTTLLYIYEGKPLATACLYPWDGKLVHDFEQLSRGKIFGRMDGAIIWRPQQSDLKFAPIPGAEPPEATPAQRLRQMSRLSEQFQSTLLGWKADNTDREQLRLLVKPLYRYQPKSGNVIDGAVYAFAMGTDPESLLLIEAVENQGQRRWEFAFARRTSGELEGRHKDKVVWHADRYPEMKNPEHPRISVGTPIPPELLAPAKE
jgi:hypothetical protein